jgi:hypothetical protein
VGSGTRNSTHDAKTEEDELGPESPPDDRYLEEEVGFLNRLDGRGPGHVVSDQMRDEGSGHGHRHADEEDGEEGCEAVSQVLSSLGAQTGVELVFHNCGLTDPLDLVESHL